MGDNPFPGRDLFHIGKLTRRSMMPHIQHKHCGPNDTHNDHPCKNATGNPARQWSQPVNKVKNRSGDYENAEHIQ